MLRVRDLDKSRRFYEDLLTSGCEPHIEERDRRTLRVEDGHDLFGLQLRESFYESNRPTIEHFSFRTDSVESLARVRARAIDLGAEVTVLHCVDDEWQFFMYDPDGHKIGVYAPLHPVDDSAS